MKTRIVSVVLLVGSMAGAVLVESHGPFDIYYYDAGDVWNGATNVQSWSDVQKEDICSAIDEWNRVLNNEPARQVRMHVMWGSYDDSVLGESSSYLFAGTDRSGVETIWTGAELVWREAYGTGNSWDTYIRFAVGAAGLSWNFGEGSPAMDQFDFRSVALHEIGHSLGWLTSYDHAYDDFGYGGYGLTSFERFLVDGNGNAPFNGGTGTPGNFNETGAPVFFNGYNATNLYGGLVPIYAPETYAPGSSLSHLDEAMFADALMTPFIGPGQSVRFISDLEIAMMADMGWDVIPEPSSIFLLLLGVAIMVSARRRIAGKTG